MYLARKLPKEPMAGLFPGPFGLENIRQVEINGRIRYDERGCPYLAYRGRRVPIVSGSSLGGALPARLAESTGTNYYTATSGNDSTGDGSSGNPWKTVQKAIDTVAANSIINVRSCTAEKLLISGRNMASTVTVQPEIGQGRLKLHNFWIEDASGVACRRWRIRGFEFDGATPAVGGSGFAGYGCNIKPNGSAACELIEIYDCWLHDHGHVLGAGANSCSCLFIGGSGRATLTNIQIWNCVMVNPGLEIYAVGDQTSSSDLFVTAVDPPGIDNTLYFETATNRDASPAPALFAYNDAGDLQRIHYTGQDTGAEKFTGSTGWTGTILDGTPITDAGRNEDHGIYVEGTGNLNTPDVLIANCIAYDIRSGFGYQIYPNAKNVWVVNSLAYGNLARAGYVIGQTGANGTINTKLTNCLAVRCDKDGNTGGYHQSGLGSGSSPVNRWDYCLGYNNPGGNFEADIGGALVSSNKIQADPLFVNATNPHSVLPPSSDIYLPSTRNFHVGSSSPDLNAGDPDYCPDIFADGSSR